MKAVLAIIASCLLYTALADEWSVQSKPGDVKLECAGGKGISGLIVSQEQSSSSSSASSSNNSSQGSSGPSGSSASSSAAAASSSSSFQYTKLTVRLFCASSEKKRIPKLHRFLLELIQISKRIEIRILIQGWRFG